MSYVGVTSPSTGDLIKASWGQTVAGDTADLNTRLSLVEAVGIPNGTFEYDDDADGIPDNWTRSVSSVSLVHDATDRAHGTKSVYFQFSATTGTGTLTSSNYTPTAHGQRIEARWYAKGSTASLPARVRLLWYADDLSYLSATTLWDVTTLATAWTQLALQAVAPSGAYYYRIELKAGDGTNGVVSETVHYDGIATRVYHGYVADAQSTEASATGTVAYTEFTPSGPASGELARACYVGSLDTDDGGGNSLTIGFREWRNGAWAVQTSSGAPLACSPDGTLQYNCTQGGAGFGTAYVYSYGYEV